MTAAANTEIVNKSNQLASTREICDVFGRRNSKGLITVELEPGSDITLHELGEEKLGHLLSRRTHHNGKIELRIIVPNNSYLVVNSHGNRRVDMFKAAINVQEVYHVLNGGVTCINITEREIKSKRTSTFDQHSVSISSMAANQFIQHLIGKDNLVTRKKHMGNVNIVIRDNITYQHMHNTQFTAMYRFNGVGDAVAIMAGEQDAILKTGAGDALGNDAYICVSDSQIVILCKDTERYRKQLLGIQSDVFLIRENDHDRNANFRFAIYPKLTVQQVKTIQNT